MDTPSISRRTLLSGAALLGAAAAGRSLFGQASPAAGPPATAPARRVGFALVGIGSFSMGQLLPSFAHCKVAKLAALVSGSPAKAAAQAARHGLDPKHIYSYENFDTLRDDPHVDVVYVVLPNGMHMEYTVRAARAGKHVLCEKPMANTAAECQAMIDACAAAKRKLMVAYRMRYDPIVIRSIELARSATDIGTIKMITAECGFAISDPRQWRLNKKLAGGGSLMDIGVYAINAIRYLTGQEPAELTALSYSTPDDPRFREVEETVNIELRFASGIMASVVSSYGFGCNRYRLYGTRGQLESEPFQAYNGTKLWHTRGRSKTEVAYTPINHFAAQMDHLAECVLNDKVPLTPGEDGLNDLKVIEAAYASAREGRVVKL